MSIVDNIIKKIIGKSENNKYIVNHIRLKNFDYCDFTNANFIINSQIIDINTKTFQYNGYAEYTFEEFTNFIISFNIRIDNKIKCLLSNIENVNIKYFNNGLYIYYKK